MQKESQPESLYSQAAKYSEYEESLEISDEEQSPRPRPTCKAGATSRSSSAMAATNTGRSLEFPPEVLRMILSYLYESLTPCKPTWDPQPAYDQATSLTACALVNSLWCAIIGEMRQTHIIVPEWRFTNATKLWSRFSGRYGREQKVKKLEIAFSSLDRLVALRVEKHRGELERQIRVERELDNSSGEVLAFELTSDREDNSNPTSIHPEEMARLVTMRAKSQILREEKGDWLEPEGMCKQLIALHNLPSIMHNLNELSLLHLPYHYPSNCGPPSWIATSLEKIQNVTLTIEHLTLSPYDFTHLSFGTSNNFPNLKSLSLHAINQTKRREWAFDLISFLKSVEFGSLTIQWRELAILNRQLRPVGVAQRPAPALPPINQSIHQITIIQAASEFSDTLVYVPSAFRESKVQRLIFEMRTVEALPVLGRAFGYILREQRNYSDLKTLVFRTKRNVGFRDCRNYHLCPDNFNQSGVILWAIGIYSN
ncbi:hypothetical protein T439DRAFT_337630 [Meredithblackwellia eburnea MCA 4105]